MGGYGLVKNVVIVQLLRHIYTARIRDFVAHFLSPYSYFYNNIIMMCVCCEGSSQKDRPSETGQNPLLF